MCPNPQWKSYTCKSMACNRLSLGKGLMSKGLVGGKKKNIDNDQ